MTIQENFSLKNHNTFGVDVSAKYFAEVHSVEELIEVLKQNPTHALTNTPTQQTQPYNTYYSTADTNTKC